MNQPHESFMQLCLEEAGKAQGRTAPNPMVGSVIVSPEGELVGRGHHRRAGEAHAEIEALNQAGESARGATLYVNLEPCCHFGRTPPCSKRLIESGIKKVIVGMKDPNPKVAGGGIKELEQHGIEVVVGVLESECRRLNRGFIKWIETKRPWVCLKMAATLDGRIADREGKSRWVTGTQARQYVHHLRDQFDCVLIGSKTAVVDNPRLVVNEVPGGRNPLRAVIDTNLSVDPASNLCALAVEDSKTVLFAAQNAIALRSAAYAKQVNLVPTAANNGHLDLAAVFDWLGANNVLTVLCEGGAHLAAELLAGGHVDEVQWIIAPKLLVDAQALSALATDKYFALPEALQLKNMTVGKLGEDILITGEIAH